MAPPDDEDDRVLVNRLRELLQAPDFSAARANARLELHEAVCDERQLSMLSSFARLETAVGAMHARLDKVSGRMWQAVAWVAGTAILALGTVVFFMIVRGFR